MVVFPGEALEVRQDAQDKALSRWSVLAAALLIAMIGFFSGNVRESQTERNIHSSDKSGGQQVSRREPVRALVVIERRDGASNHWHGADGGFSPAAQDIALPIFKLAVSPVAGSATAATAYWPAALPRAPPAF